MTKRLAFNGGEISPAMALRSDMDVYARSCSTLTNFDVAATGGIKRRTGMRHLAYAQGEASVLMPYVYSEEVTYLCELSAEALFVRDPDTGRIVAEFHASDMTDAQWSYPELRRVTWLQINSLLLICAPTTPVMQLKMYAKGGFDFSPFEFATPPWESEDLQDAAARLTPTADRHVYRVDFELPDEDDDEEEPTEPEPGDALRFSYYTPQRETFARAASLKAGLSVCAAITPASSYSPGSKLAWEGEAAYEYYVCTKDWTGANDFTEGFSSPANYKDNFAVAEDLTGFDGGAYITALSSGSVFHKGDKVAIRAGYWHLYTCIRAFTADDYVTGCASPGDYPRHFVRGIPVGEALPCGGKWQFFCSGTWYGSYDIRRNFTTGELAEPWEHMWESKSSIGHALNEAIAGNEEEEECWLRLFLTSVRYLNASPGSAFPADYCSNRLIVYPYRHNMQLTIQNDGLAEDTSPVVIPLKSPLSSKDWSLAAFCRRNGYPSLACLHESRLVFAATVSQPQTLWLSRSDDLNNFATGDLDSHGALLTMSTTTQAAICWLISRGKVIMLGTEDAEWIIHNPSGGALTPTGAAIVNHGRLGSAHMPAITANDRVLYCERGAGRLYQYAYNYESDSYTSTDLTIFADHIAANAGGITGGCVMKKPYCAVCFTTGGGTLLKMTYNTMHSVNAWHRYETQGRVESVCALPHGNHADRLYLLVSRQTEGGEDTRRLEVMEDESGLYADGEEGFSYTSTMETTVFSMPDRSDRLVHAAPLQIYLAEPLPAKCLSLSAGSGYTQRLDRTGILPVGWHDLVTPGGWSRCPFFGLRVSGGTGASFLAVQG